MLPRHAMVLLVTLLVDLPRIVLAQDSTHTTAYATEVEPSAAPVILDGNVLFTVRGVSAYPAAQRADAITCLNYHLLSIAVDNDNGNHGEGRAMNRE